MANRAGVAKPGAAKTKSSFFGGIAAELKKVVWLSKRETAYLTLVVIIVAVIAGLALGGWTWVLLR